MPKDKAALRTIGELSQDSGIPAHVLRYWERHVPALNPMRRAGGRRYYRATDVELVQRLQQLVMQDGYTLEGAARAVQALTMIDNRAVSSSPAIAAAATGNGIDLVTLTKLRDRLSAALSP